jgi:hypothetical protein
MLKEMFVGTSLGKKSAVAVAVAKESEAFALKIGMHSPSLASVSSELARVSYRMVPTPFVFIDTLSSNITRAAAAFGAGMGAGAISASGIKPVERLKTPDITKLGRIPEVGTFDIPAEAVAPFSAAGERSRKAAAVGVKQMMAQETAAIQRGVLAMDKSFRPFALFPSKEKRELYPTPAGRRRAKTKPFLRIWPVGDIEKLFRGGERDLKANMRRMEKELNRHNQRQMFKFKEPKIVLPMFERPKKRRRKRR